MTKLLALILLSALHETWAADPLASFSQGESSSSCAASGAEALERDSLSQSDLSEAWAADFVPPFGAPRGGELPLEEWDFEALEEVLRKEEALAAEVNRSVPQSLPLAPGNGLAPKKIPRRLHRQDHCRQDEERDLDKAYKKILVHHPKWSGNKNFPLSISRRCPAWQEKGVPPRVLDKINPSREVYIDMPRLEVVPPEERGSVKKFLKKAAKSRIGGWMEESSNLSLPAGFKAEEVGCSVLFKKGLARLRELEQDFKLKKDLEVAGLKRRAQDLGKEAEAFKAKAKESKVPESQARARGEEALQKGDEAEVVRQFAEMQKAYKATKELKEWAEKSMAKAREIEAEIDELERKSNQMLGESLKKDLIFSREKAKVTKEIKKISRNGFERLSIYTDTLNEALIEGLLKEAFKNPLGFESLQISTLSKSIKSQDVDSLPGFFSPVGEKLRRQEGLRAISIPPEIGLSGLEFIAKNAPNLEEMEVGRPGEDNAHPAFLEGLTRLEWPHLKRLKVVEEEFPLWALLGRSRLASQLEEIVFEGDGDTCLDLGSASFSFPKLKVIYFQNVNLRAYLPRLDAPYLTAVRLWNVGLTLSDLSYLIKDLPQLTDIELGGHFSYEVRKGDGGNNGGGDEPFILPAAMRIRFLSLPEYDIDDKALSALLSENSFETLECLNLRDNKITSKGMKALVRKRFLRLKKVSFEANEIGEEGIKILIKHKERFPGLKFLDLRGTAPGLEPEIDLKYKAALRQAFPEAEILL